MLLIGTQDCLPDFPIHVLNLSSYVQNVPMVKLLPPTNGILPFDNERDFDIAYANYIMSNDLVFMELMNNIIMPLYFGEDIYLLVSRDPFYDMVTESLIKFIQVRYSYIAQIVQTKEDLDFIDKDSTFETVQGLFNLDQDKERYSRLIAPQLMDQDGTIHYGNKEEAEYE